MHYQKPIRNKQSATKKQLIASLALSRSIQKVTPSPRSLRKRTFPRKLDISARNFTVPQVLEGTLINNVLADLPNLPDLSSLIASHVSVNIANVVTSLMLSNMITTTMSAEKGKSVNPATLSLLKSMETVLRTTFANTFSTEPLIKNNMHSCTPLRVDVLPLNTLINDLILTSKTDTVGSKSKTRLNSGAKVLRKPIKKPISETANALHAPPNAVQKEVSVRVLADSLATTKCQEDTTFSHYIRKRLVYSEDPKDKTFLNNADLLKDFMKWIREENYEQMLLAAEVPLTSGNWLNVVPRRITTIMDQLFGIKILIKKKNKNGLVAVCFRPPDSNHCYTSFTLKANSLSHEACVTEPYRNPPQNALLMDGPIMDSKCHKSIVGSDP